MNDKIISILIPVYNVADKIERCLISIFANEIIDKCEVVLVNDCSTDNSMDVVNNFLVNNPTYKIKIINHQKNMGLACARISAFSEATGEYVICVDSDDWIEKDYLSELYNIAKKSNADVVGCDTYVDFDYKQSVRKQNLKGTGKECLRNLLIGQTPGFIWLKMIRRQFAVENNINWIPNIDMFEDVVFTTQLFYYATRISYLEKPLYHYVQNKGSYTNSKINEKKAQQLVSALNWINEFFKEKNETELLELVKIEKLNVKSWILFQGTPTTRKKYYSLWSDCQKNIGKLKDSTFKRFILKISVKHPLFIDFILNINDKRLFLKVHLRNCKNLLFRLLTRANK